MALGTKRDTTVSAAAPAPPHSKAKKTVRSCQSTSALLCTTTVSSNTFCIHPFSLYPLTQSSFAYSFSGPNTCKLGFLSGSTRLLATLSTLLPALLAVSILLCSLHPSSPDFSSSPAAQSNPSPPSHGRTCLIPFQCSTTSTPRHAATSTARPGHHNNTHPALQYGLTRASTHSTSATRPSTTNNPPRNLTNATLAGFAFRRAKRRKRGWERARSPASAAARAGRRAEGCVVCPAARRQASRSRGERARRRGAAVGCR